MTNRLFADKLNTELDHMGVPLPIHERIEALAKLLKIPRFKAESFLNGNIPNTEHLDYLANELEVSTDWLLGKSEHRQQTKQ